MTQFHFDPVTYLDLMRQELPAYERLQEAVARGVGRARRGSVAAGVGARSRDRDRGDAWPRAAARGGLRAEVGAAGVGRRAGSFEGVMTPAAEESNPPAPADEESLHRALGLTDDEFEAVAKILGPPAQPPRARPLRGDVERALLLQVVPPAPAPPAHRGRPGPGRSRRERGRDRRRRRHRGGHPHREPQPPFRHRALPGRGHRGRRHPARHLHHGGPPAGRHGPALLRAARRRPAALAGRGRGRAASRATATRSACPRSGAS